MGRPLDEIVADLDALDDDDFKYFESPGGERLYDLCQELRDVPDTQTGAVITTLLAFAERCPDGSLGGPGPVVHTIEARRPGYEPFLEESLARRSVPVTVLMVNRILNTHPEDSVRWIRILRTILSDTSASPKTHEYARWILKRHTGESS
jgi:hypothetical protein